MGHALVDGSLERQLGDIGPGDHLCLIYETAEEQLAAAVPFVRQGLERGERCAYIADERTAGEVAGAMEAAGVDVARERERGAFLLMDTRDAYLRSGSFDPDGMLAFLVEATEQASAAGYAGFRVTGEMTWALGGEIGCDRVVEYEAKLNRFFPGSRALAICQYNRRRFSPTIVRDIIRSHPIVIVGGQVCSQNLYYEAPHLMLEEPSAGEYVEWMLGRLHRARVMEQEGEAALAREQAARQQAEAATRARDEFLSIAAHELKTPMTSLLGYAQLLASGLDADGALDPVRARPALETISRQALKLSRLIAQLLDISRLESGQLRLEREHTNLGRLVESAVQDARARTDRHVITVQGVDELYALADPLRLEQVLTNLLDNAIKYSPPGGEIEVAVDRSGPGMADLSVRDHGAGIPPERRAHIFERFYRAHVHDHASGMGLGLYISRHIVELHGGELDVRFPDDGGTLFIVRLPVEPNPGH